MNASPRCFVSQNKARGKTELGLQACDILGVADIPLPLFISPFIIYHFLDKVEGVVYTLTIKWYKVV